MSQLALLAESMLKCIALDVFTVDDEGYNICRGSTEDILLRNIRVKYTSSLAVSKIRCMASHCW